jgi:hypothetical protein
MRFTAAWLLIFAAILKAIQLLNEVAVGVVGRASAFVRTSQIVIEITLAVLLLSNAYQGRLRRITAIVFVGFAAYSLSLALHGSKSCGCFGDLKVDPWSTFAIDSIVALGLVVPIHSLAFLRSGTASPIRAQSQLWCATKRLGERGVALATIVIISTLAYGLHANHLEIFAGNILEMEKPVTILEPDKWIGKALPILDDIDITLPSGDCTVVLHRHDCPACQEALPKYERLAALGKNVALIELPPYGPVPTTGACLSGHLAGDRKWFVRTPVEIIVLDGIVKSVNQDPEEPGQSAYRPREHQHRTGSIAGLNEVATGF